MECEGATVADTLDRAVGGKAGWLAACAQPLYPGEQLPTTLGAPARDDTTLTALFAAARAAGWTGKRLLLAGCSAGATRYPVVAARTMDDTRWLGTERTAACFSDGVFDLAAQDDFTGVGAIDGGTSCAARHRRIAEAFTTAAPRPGHACTASPGGQCACDPARMTRLWPGSCGTGDCLTFESIATPAALAPGVSPSDFAVAHWKIVSEGSSFANTPERCTRDVVPEPPQVGLCSALARDPSHSCTLEAWPASPHCGAFGQNLPTICVDWFEAL
ncbi:MAG: hypothetical protein JNJ54_17790 [Myxococcaceae bacterium]|nr:hypothetical protein [Myxococcaceae bacterium]